MSERSLMTQLAEVVVAFASCDECAIENGECQTHGWFVEDGARCPNEVAWTLVGEAAEVEAGTARSVLGPYLSPDARLRGWSMMPVSVLDRVAEALVVGADSRPVEGLVRALEAVRGASTYGEAVSIAEAALSDWEGR